MSRSATAACAAPEPAARCNRRRRGALALALPTKNGVGASCLALPSGTWVHMLDFLVHRLPALDAQQWRQRMLDGEVLDEQGQTLAPDAPYRPQSRLYYWRKLDFEHPVPFREQIVYQDDFLLVADKPHFLAVTPKGRHVQETLLVRLKRRTGIDSLAPMHRIDRETAGLVIFTLQPHTRAAYQDLLRLQQVHKTYEALTPWHASMEGRSWPFMANCRLLPSEHFMAMQCVDGPPNAQTEMSLLERRGPWARWRLHPITGRKHQLRAQLNALGMPILGDRIYPVLQPHPPLDAPADFSQPLQLLAKSVRFKDPLSGVWREFESTQTLQWPSPA